MIGEDVVSNYEIVNHDLRDESQLSYIGKSLYDIPIYVNKALTECTFA